LRLSTVPKDVYQSNDGFYRPQPMTEEQIEQTKLQADYDGIFYNYADKGYTVEFTGKETVDDIETYVLN